MDTFNFVASATVSIPGSIVSDPNTGDNTDTVSQALWLCGVWWRVVGPV